MLPAEGISEEELLTMAYTLEQKSEHPLAKPVLEEAQSRELKPRMITDFTGTSGQRTERQDRRQQSARWQLYFYQRKN